MNLEDLESGVNGPQAISPRNPVNLFLNPIVAVVHGQHHIYFNPDKNINEACGSFQNRPRHCAQLSDCPLLSNALNNALPAEAYEILRRSTCGFSHNVPLVCCPVQDGFEENDGANHFAEQGNKFSEGKRYINFGEIQSALNT